MAVATTSAGLRPCSHDSPAAKTALAALEALAVKIAVIAADADARPLAAEVQRLVNEGECFQFLKAEVWLNLVGEEEHPRRLAQSVEGDAADASFDRREAVAALGDVRRAGSKVVGADLVAERVVAAAAPDDQPALAWGAIIAERERGVGGLAGLDAAALGAVGHLGVPSETRWYPTRGCWWRRARSGGNSAGYVDWGVGGEDRAW